MRSSSFCYIFFSWMISFIFLVLNTIFMLLTPKFIHLAQTYPNVASHLIQLSNWPFKRTWSKQNACFISISVPFPIIYLSVPIKLLKPENWESTSITLSVTWPLVHKTLIFSTPRTNLEFNSYILSHYPYSTWHLHCLWDYCNHLFNFVFIQLWGENSGQRLVNL